jgi:hypothetical protein
VFWLGVHVPTQLHGPGFALACHCVYWLCAKATTLQDKAGFPLLTGEGQQS